MRLQRADERKIRGLRPAGYINVAEGIEGQPEGAIVAGPSDSMVQSISSVPPLGRKSGDKSVHAPRFQRGCRPPVDGRSGELVQPATTILLNPSTASPVIVSSELPPK